MQRREVEHVAVSHITSLETKFKKIQSFKELLAKQAPLKDGITYFITSLIITRTPFIGKYSVSQFLEFCNSIRNSRTNEIK
jgi:hypothetical protein